MERSKEVVIVKARGGEEPVSEKDRVIREVPFTLWVNGKELATILCTPTDLHYLALGFLFSEGILKWGEKIRNITLNENRGFIHIDLEDDGSLREIDSSRIIGSGCVGAVPFYRASDARDSLALDYYPLQVTNSKVLELMGDFQSRSTLFRETGGVHCCALANPEVIEIFQEDIGRHNAMDKVIGEAYLKGISTEGKIILTTGRVSSEILLKATRARIPLVVSRSSPTDLALSLADSLNVTVLGFVRGTRFNIYTHFQRIIFA